MTFPLPIKQLQFFLTAPSPCPYLPGQQERKLFTQLRAKDGHHLNDMLTQHGFRRAQNIAYSPACETCSACRSARILVNQFKPARTMRRILRKNQDLTRYVIKPVADAEHFALISKYLCARHQEGGMEGMDNADFTDLVEDTMVNTELVDYRDSENNLFASILVDQLADGPSLVYSFFDPRYNSRSLGSFMILDHIERAIEMELEHLYLGFWVKGSDKMEYKKNYQPMEIFTPDGWEVWQGEDT